MHAPLTHSKSFMDVLQEQIEDQQSKLLDQHQMVTAFPVRAVVSPIVPEREGLRTAERALQHTAGRESYGVQSGVVKCAERSMYNLSDSSSAEYDISPDGVMNTPSVALGAPTAMSNMTLYQPVFRAVI